MSHTPHVFVNPKGGAPRRPGSVGPPRFTTPPPPPRGALGGMPRGPVPQHRGPPPPRAGAPYGMHAPRGAYGPRPQMGPPPMAGLVPLGGPVLVAGAPAPMPTMLSQPVVVAGGAPSSYTRNLNVPVVTPVAEVETYELEVTRDEEYEDEEPTPAKAAPGSAGSHGSAGTDPVGHQRKPIVSPEHRFRDYGVEEWEWEAAQARLRTEWVQMNTPPSAGAAKAGPAAAAAPAAAAPGTASSALATATPAAVTPAASPMPKNLASAFERGEGDDAGSIPQGSPAPSWANKGTHGISAPNLALDDGDEKAAKTQGAMSHPALDIALKEEEESKAALENAQRARRNTQEMLRRLRKESTGSRPVDMSPVTDRSLHRLEAEKEAAKKWEDAKQQARNSRGDLLPM